MDNTIILVYGVSPERQREIVENFDWKSVLSGSKRLSQSEFNPRVFSLTREFDISANRKDICVHPGDERTFKKAIDVMTSAISAYYDCDCHIEGDYSQITVAIRFNDKLTSDVVMIDGDLFPHT